MIFFIFYDIIPFSKRGEKMKKLISILSVYLCAISYASAHEITYSPYISTKIGYSFNDLAIDLQYLNLPTINDEESDYINQLFDSIEEITQNFKVGIHTKNTYSINPGIGVKIELDDIKFLSFRVEGEYMHNQQTSTNTIDVQKLFTAIGMEEAPVFDVTFNSRTDTFFLNGYVDLKTDTFIKPFLSLGLGYTNFEANVKLNTDALIGLPLAAMLEFEEKNIAWSIGFGLSFEVKDNVFIDTQYRYIDYGKISIGDEFIGITELTGGVASFDSETFAFTQDAHQLSVGLRVHF